MGACMSQQPAVAVVGEDPLKPSKGSRQASHSPPESQATDPVPEESVPITATPATSTSTLPPEAAAPPMREPSISPGQKRVTIKVEAVNFEDEPAPIKEGAGHVRKKSDMVVDYLRSTGPASNRGMVHIETPFGPPIEEVYDGVHDGHVLGEGITGEVRLIVHRGTGVRRAVKRLDLGGINDDDAAIDLLLNEIKIMCSLDHPNVVCLEEVFEGDSELFLTQELCEGGDLFDRLENEENERFEEGVAAKLVKQIISSVSYLHGKGIVHRDLKLENFLFQDKTNGSELKMIDFGLSKHIMGGVPLHDAVGTPYTVAPEVILEKGYDEKCDVWGIGVIAYLLLTGDTPFGGAYPDDNLLEVKRNILAGHVSFEDPLWRTISPAAVNFIQSALALDPADRPSASELSYHPWIKSMKRNSSLTSDESNPSTTVVDGLLSFKELSSTRKFLREVISYTLQPEQIHGLHEEFEKFDVDGKGEISLHCFKLALMANSEQHPLSESEIEDIFNGLKVRNTDMSIRWHEFIAASLSQCHIDDRNIRLAFDRLDNEHKGYITLADLKEAMEFYGSVSNYDLQSIWINNVMDYKSDKQHMSYEDFYKLLKLDTEMEPKGQELFVRQSDSNSSRAARQSLARSYVGTAAHGILGQDASEIWAAPLDDPPSNEKWQGSRRHSLSQVVGLDLAQILRDDQNPDTFSKKKAAQDIHNFVLEASRRVEEEKLKKDLPRRKASITGTKGLLMRRDTQESYVPISPGVSTR